MGKLEGIGGGGFREVTQRKQREQLPSTPKSLSKLSFESGEREDVLKVRSRTMGVASRNWKPQLSCVLLLLSPEGQHKQEMRQLRAFYARGFLVQRLPLVGWLLQRRVE